MPVCVAEVIHTVEPRAEEVSLLVRCPHFRG